MKLRDKIIINIVIPVISLFFVIAYISVQEMKKDREKSLNTKIESLNKLIVNVNIEPLWNLDMFSVNSNIETFFEMEEVSKIILRDRLGNEIINLKKDYPSEIEYIFNLEKVEEKLGSVEVGYSYKKIQIEMQSIISKFGWFIFAVVLLLIFVILLFSQLIYAPLKHLVRGIQNIDEGKLDFRLNLRDNTEFKIVEQYFNKMVGSLQKSDNQNRTYFKELEDKRNELQAAYNEMKAINETLTLTFKELELSENRYRDIFNYSPDGIIIIDINEEDIHQFNREFLNIVEIRTIDIMNLKLIDIFYQKDIDHILLNIREAGFLYNYETKIKLLDKYVVISSIAMEHDEDQVQFVIRDITERKKLQEELSDYAKVLERKVRERTIELEEANFMIKQQQEEMIKDAYNQGLIEVTSGIIHNIGNIINIIYLSIEEMLDSLPKGESSSSTKFFEKVVYPELVAIEDKSPKLKKIIEAYPRLIETIKEYEGYLNNQVDFLSKKVVHLKDIISLQQNFVGGLGTEDYNSLKDMTTEILEIYKSSLEKRGIEVIFSFDEMENILCDKSQILQVLGNLIKNAYEAIEENNQAHGIIEVNGINTENGHEVRIRDNGSGISREDLKNIFEFGFSTKKIKGKGSGFGLHSAKEIISKYGGDIRVESEEGEGTEFILLFPHSSRSN